MITPSTGRSHRSANRVSSAARRTADRPGPAPPARFAPPARAPRRVMRTEPETWVPGCRRELASVPPSSKTVSSWLAEPMRAITRPPGLSETPLSSTCLVTVRPTHWTLAGTASLVTAHRASQAVPPRHASTGQRPGGRPAFHCRRSRRSPRSACLNPGTPAGRCPCRTTATRAHATEWLTTLRHLRPGLRRGGHSWSQSCGCARYSRASLIAPMSDRCGLFARGAEAAALSQLGVPGSGAAGLRTRKIRNPGSLLSLS